MKISFILILLLIWVTESWTQDLSVSNKSQLSLEENIDFIGHWSTSGRCKSSFIAGNYAYLTNNNKLEILDISDPTSPNLVGQAELNSSFLSEDIFLKNNQVYIANYRTIYVYDISDPSNPDTVTSFELESIINDIQIVENLLYVIASYDFYILDISDPATITQLGKLTLPDASLGLTRFHVLGDYAYIGSWSDGLYIIDIVDKTNPSIHGRFLERSYIVFAQEPYAYVADSQYLYILDITDKVIPDIVDRRNNVEIPHDIFVDDKNIYAATDGGLVIYDKEDLSFVSSHPIADISERVIITDGLTYLSSNSEGLNIFQYINPNAVEDSDQNIFTFKLDQNYPNPFNPSTTIKYSIPNQSNNEIEQNVKLTVYDFLGREVAILVNSKQKYGNYEANFNSINMTSGIYFYRLEIGGSSISKKMLLLK